MDFHLSFTPRPFDTRINLRHQLLLTGSCFTEQIGQKLAQHKFRILDNPNGILFNPVSITRSLLSYISPKEYTAGDLFYQNECWNSWEHHSRFSHPDPAVCLRLINSSQQAAHAFLKEADWLLITLGSAFVYERAGGEVVANCHKVPTDKFHKRLLGAEEVTGQLHDLQEQLLRFNPGLKIIYTISPVRHLRDGFIENNRSKATLIQAVHALTGAGVYYFPAYELVIDDLRDYRFYAEDMVHPNYAATNYVWEKFTAACMDEESRSLMKELAVLVAARNHKPFNPASDLHKKFLATNLEKARQLQAAFPFLHLSEEIRFFSGTGSE
ncbi:MAG: GSCFA domain-containing protein [Ferruginibacter sp.]